MKAMRVEFRFDERSLMALDDLKRKGMEFREIPVGNRVIAIPTKLRILLCSSTSESEERTA